MSWAVSMALLLAPVRPSGGEPPKRDPVEDPFPEAQAEIHQVIGSIIRDAESGNVAGLQSAHLDSEKFTKFGPRSFERQDVAGTNESEAAFFGSITGYRQEARELKVDVFGEVAVATYYPHVSFVQHGETRQGSGRQTFVFLETPDGWKLVHEHGTPRPKESREDLLEAANTEIVQVVYSEVWSKGRIDLIGELFAEQFVGHFPAGTVHGREGLRMRLLAHRAAFPDWNEEAEDVIADGDRVAVRFTSRGTNLGEFLGSPPTGNRVEISEVAIFRLSDGEIVEQWVYPDMLSMQRQLGQNEQQ